jgi:hypothetical protein
MLGDAATIFAPPLKLLVSIINTYLDGVTESLAPKKQIVLPISRIKIPQFLELELQKLVAPFVRC